MKKIVLAEPSNQIAYITNLNTFALHEQLKDKNFYWYCVLVG